MFLGLSAIICEAMERQHRGQADSRLWRALGHLDKAFVRARLAVGDGIEAAPRAKDLS